MSKMKALFEKYKNMSVIVRASVWFVAVTIVDRAISVFTQPFVNRILTTEEVGVYGVYTSWQSILLIIATFNLFCGVLEVYITKSEEDKHNVVGSLNILSLLISLIVFGIIFLFIKPVSSFLSLKPRYILMMALSILGDMMFQFWAVPKRFEYSYKVYSFLTVGLFFVRSVASVLLTYLWPGDRIFGRLVGLSVPAFICGLVLFYKAMSRTDFRQITKYWKPALKFNLPLIPHYLAAVLLSSSDRIMIEKLGSLSDTGLYAIAYTFSGLCLIVFSAINSAYNPYSMKCIKDKKYEGLDKTTQAMIIFSILFSLLMIYLAPEGLYILGGEKYLEALPLVPVLVVGIYLSSFYFIFSNVEFVHEKTKWIFPITLFGALLNIGLNYALIPIFGYVAAAYTTLIGYLVIAVLHYVVSRRILKQDIYNIKNIVLLLIGFMILAAIGLVLYKVYFLIRYAVILLGIVLLLIYGRKKKDILFKREKPGETADDLNGGKV